MRSLLVVALLGVVMLVATPAFADDAAELRPAFAADLGLSVIGLAYEHPVLAHVAIMGEAEIFGTYFLPWFDRGDNVQGVGVGVRPTWFASETGHGLYVAPYLRVVGVRESKAGVVGTGFGYTAGAFVGWAFGLVGKLDMRVGVGAQYIKFDADPYKAATPFVALDLVLAYRR